MIKHLNILTSGIVQGVSFRQQTKQKADELGITGFVMNKPDGTVLIEAEGEPEVLEKFVQWCRGGPKYAQVRHIEVQETGIANFASFQIRR